jgi:uncharacterized protein YfaS (alpha-2-macroglobulin family)
MTLQRSYFDLRGEPVDPARLTQGQLLTVVLEGELRSKQEHPLLLMDLLPAGLQAENPRLGKGLDSGRLPWLGQLTSARYRDLLDDRVVFALDMPAGEKPRPFRIAYLARVISQGDYYWPPAEIEDMYRPRYRARSAPTNIQVTHP